MRGGDGRIAAATLAAESEASGGRATEPISTTDAALRAGSKRISGVARGAAPARPARILSIGGGKGGVGKTFIAANMAVALARAGYRVVAVDGDLEGANLHTCLGVRSPRTSLADFVAQREDDLAKLKLPTSVAGLEVIAGTQPNLAGAQPSHLLRVRLVRELRKLDADYVIIDLGAGTDVSTLDYFLVADDGLVVVRPEPTSVENAYSFLRAAFYRRLRLAMVGNGVRKLITQAMDQRNERGIRTPLDLLREVEALDSTEARRFVQAMREFRPRLIINEVRTAEDIKLGFAVRSVCKKYFGFDSDYLGYVNFDDAVRESVSARTPVLELNERSDASVYLQRIVRKLVASHGHPRRTANTISEAAR
jgi:flagellar biosynthesis protein FlhG